MGGIFGGGGGGGSTAPKKTVKQIETEEKATEAQERTEERAEAQERTEMQGVQKRRRLRQRGGMRLLFSPLRQEGPGSSNTKLGGG